MKTYIEHVMLDGRGAVVLPCRLEQILWYILGGRIYTAKVCEIKWQQASSGNCGEDCIVFAWDCRNNRQLTWCPISGEGWLDTKDSYVPVFYTRAEAEAAMKGAGNEP